MISVSILYPNTEGKKFDMADYCTRHIPMVQQKLGAACKGVNVDQGLSGTQAGSKASYTAITHLLFESVEAFQTAFEPHAEVLLGDIPNFTDIEPIIQISEVQLRFPS